MTRDQGWAVRMLAKLKTPEQWERERPRSDAEREMAQRVRLEIERIAAGEVTLRRRVRFRNGVTDDRRN
jgi:hypothetical protein